MVIAIGKLPMPILGVINNLGPILAMIINVFRHEEEIYKNKYIYIFLSFLGISLICASNYFRTIFFSEGDK